MISVDPQPDDAGPTVRMHRLVQQMLRARLEAAGEANHVAALAIALVNLQFPSGGTQGVDIDTWEASSRLLSHALSVLEHVSPVGKTLLATTDLINKVGLYLIGRDEHETAARLLADAVAFDAAAGEPPRHEQLARDYNNLGLAQHGLGQLDAALSSYHQAITHGAAIANADPTAQATRFNNLALLLIDRGQHQEAEPLLRRALDSNTAAHGEGHGTVAVNQNNLGLLLLDTGRLDEAEQALQAALAIWQSGLGPESIRSSGRASTISPACCGRWHGRQRPTRPIARPRPSWRPGCPRPTNGSVMPVSARKPPSSTDVHCGPDGRPCAAHRGLSQHRIACSAVTVQDRWRKEMARETGLEPAASAVTGRRSNQLSYSRASGAGGRRRRSERSSRAALGASQVGCRAPRTSR